MSKPPKHSNAAEKAHPAPDRENFKVGKEYAEACRLVSEARTEFDKAAKSAKAKVSASPSKSTVARSGSSKSKQKPGKAVKPLTTAQRLDKIGIDAICARIADGEDDGTIAESLGMARTQLRDWIQSRGHGEKVSSARENSAEAWLDKGLSTIASALSKEGGIDSSAARAYAQECARRAAIRNPAYRDKQDVNHGGQPGNPVEFTKIERIIVGQK